jgi:hypothetical protein
MTKNFDTFLESMISEMMPASMMNDFGPGEMTSAVSKKVKELPGKSQHWGPIQKLPEEKREKIIRAIIDNVFTEKGNTYTPMADNKEELKALIKSAITKTTSEYPEFKAGGKWAVQFLADRLSNEELLGKVQYTTETGKEIKADVTQKEFKAALNKALEDAPKESVWKKTSDKEESKPEEKLKEEPSEETSEKEVELVYTKAADLNSDDPDLQKAFAKLPEDKELSWQEIVKQIGTTKALKLMDSGGITETAKEKEVGEEEDVPALEVSDDEDVDLSNFDKFINPYFSTTKGSYSWDD